jgi:hypothetical protein
VFARHLIFKVIAPRKKDGYFISSLESGRDFTPEKKWEGSYTYL